MALNRKVHDYRIQEGPDGPQTKLVKTTPYSRLVYGEPGRNEDGERVMIQHTPVNVQAGAFYSDGGDRIKKEDVPDWAWNALRKMSPEGLSALKITLPKTKPKRAPSSARQNLTADKGE